MRLLCYTDAGHGWFKVDRALLEKLGIAGDISPYSYQRNGSVYLEEDCDAGHLFRALDERHITWTYRECHTNKTSKIRGYDSYKKGASHANNSIHA
jgi:hypothetical protein